MAALLMRTVRRVARHRGWRGLVALAAPLVDRI